MSLPFSMTGLLFLHMNVSPKLKMMADREDSFDKLTQF
jgi:hypothetical protein